MNATLLDLFSAFAGASVRGSALILLLLVLRVALRRQLPAQVWCVAWLLVAARLLVPFTIGVAWLPIHSLTKPTEPVAVSAPPAVLAASNVVLPPPAPSAPTFTPAVPSPVPLAAADGPARAGRWPIGAWPWREILAASWLAGIAVLVTSRIVATMRLQRRLRAAPISGDPRLAAITRQEATRLGRRAAPDCYETPVVEAPAVYGLLKPRLLFPPGFAPRLSDDELRLVLRHELGHWTRGDLWAQALMHLASVLHWANPLGWLAARLARTDCEVACDQLVLRGSNGEEAEAYGAALLNVLSVANLRRRPAQVVAILEGRRELVHRLRMIGGFRATSRWRLLAGAACALALASLTAIRESRAAPAAASDTPAAAATGAGEVTPSVLFKKSGDGWTALGTRDARETLLRELATSGTTGRVRVFMLESGQIIIRAADTMSPPPGSPAPTSVVEGAELPVADAIAVLRSSLSAPAPAETRGEVRPAPAVPTRTSNSSDPIEGLRDQVNRQKAIVEQLARRLQDFTLEHNLTSLDAKRDIATETLKAINLEVIHASQAMANADARAAQVAAQRAKKAPLTDLPFIAHQSLVARLMEVAAQKRSAIAQLRTKYLERHPMVLDAQNALAATETELARAVDDVCAQVDADLDAAKKNYEMQQAELDRWKRQSLELDRLALERDEIARELRTQQQILAAMTEHGAPRTGPSAAAEFAAAREASPTPARDDLTVSVVGAVNNQSGVGFAANEKPMVLDAIARAGGFAANANRAAVRLIRSGAGIRKTLTLSEDDLMNGTGEAGQLQRGDVIIVPELPRSTPRFVSIFGAVNKAGRIPLPELSEPKMTLVELVAQAGGPSRLADLKHVQISRVNPKTHATESFTVDVTAIMRGGSDLATIELEAGDMVTVPERIL